MASRQKSGFVTFKFVPTLGAPVSTEFPWRKGITVGEVARGLKYDPNRIDFTLEGGSVVGPDSVLGAPLTLIANERPRGS